MRRGPRGRARAGCGVYLDFADAIKRLGVDTIRERYGNLFEMYQRITDENPYELPMRIFPAVHYTMGGLWVDYNLMSTIPGLHVIGEANFSDHGANRLGASALMQGLADGYFILPSTVSDYLAGARLGAGRHVARPSSGGWRPRSPSGCGRSSRSRASGPWTRSTASSAGSCGTGAAWRGTRPGCRRRSRGSPSSGKSSGATSTCPGATRS